MATDIFLGVIAYALCGVLSVIRFQSHPWQFARTFNRDYWVLSAVSWPVLRLMVFVDQPRGTSGLDAWVKAWLATFERPDAS